ncbi:MAG: glycosyltransferase, partial [Treponemataceae bacterium]|nr:glycosyltransferase [Treponemataceae bacterium]
MVKYSFMNIALFTDSFLPTKSGIVTVVLQLQRILVAMGHNVVIVTTDTHDKYIEEKLSDKSNILRMKSFSSALFGVPDQFISIVDKKRLIAFLKEHNVEFIHSHTEFSIGQAAKFASKELGIPAIATTHTLWEDFYKYYLWGGKFIPVKLIRRIVRWMYRDFYALINVSQKAHEYFKLPFMLPQSPSAIIPNALDSETFLRHTISEEKIQAVREKWGIKKGDVVFLFLGRVVYEKRVEELLDICLRVIQKNEHIKILFVGDGLALQALKKKSAKFSDRIIFTGYVPWRDVHSFYQLGDVYVTASLSEMHSMTVLEALMSGLPVVVRYDTSFSDTVFHGDNGY